MGKSPCFPKSTGDFLSTPLFFEKKEKSVDNRPLPWYSLVCSGDEPRTAIYGGIAQLGERVNGIQEVSGAILLISTMTIE